MNKGVFCVGTLQLPVLYSLRVDNRIQHSLKPSVIVKMTTDNGEEIAFFEGILIAEDNLRYKIAKVKDSWVGKQE
jgi:hypothetical protein